MSFLPGMFPGVMNDLGFNLEFVGSASDNNNSIDISSISPGSIQAGDLCLIFQIANGSSPVNGTPSGFTQLVFEDDPGSDTMAKISAKKLTGSETTVTGFNGATNNAITALVFRPSRFFTSFVLGGSNSNITDNNPSAQIINVEDATTRPVLAFGMMAGFVTVDPRTISPAMDEIELTGGAPALYTHYKIYNTSGALANHSYDMDDEGDQNTMLSGYLTFT